MGKEIAKTNNAKPTIKKDVVRLETIKPGELEPREFSIEQANKLLKLQNAQWKLADQKYNWNGIEIAKV